MEKLGVPRDLVDRLLELGVCDEQTAIEKVAAGYGADLIKEAEDLDDRRNATRRENKKSPSPVNATGTPNKG